MEVSATIEPDVYTTLSLQVGSKQTVELRRVASMVLFASSVSSWTLPDMVHPKVIRLTATVVRTAFCGSGENGGGGGGGNSGGDGNSSGGCGGGDG